MASTACRLHHARVVKHAAGDVISGTLRLVRRIAEGGMGSVWLADHLALGTQVAVKFLAPQWDGVPAAQQRFLREARLTARVTSPHVVRALDCRRSESDEPYLVLELLRGENLEERVRRSGALSVFEVVEIVGQACEALAATHAAGIIHRDVKPENVFLVAGGGPFVKLLDFGVATPTNPDERLPVDLLAAGTPQYMSPEQMFEPESADARSDLFSLGAVAYFAMTRRSPFAADTLEGLYFAIEDASFAPPSRLRPELPPEIDAWFDKALAKRPSDRFRDAREMASALYDAVRCAASGRPTIPERAPADVPAVPAAERPRIRSRAAFASVLVLAAVGTFFLARPGPDVPSAVAKPSSTPPAAVSASPDASTALVVAP